LTRENFNRNTKCFLPCNLVFTKKSSKNCVVFQLYSIVWQNSELHERIAGREWLRSTNFYLSTKSRGWNGGHFRFQIHTSMTCGRMEFRFSELRRVYIHRFACLGRFYHWHRAGECSLLENCSPLYENAHRFHEPHIATMQCPLRMSCDATASSLSINWLCHVVMKPRCKASAASARKYSEVCDLFRFFCHNVQFCTTKIKIMRK